MTALQKKRMLAAFAAIMLCSAACLVALHAPLFSPARAVAAPFLWGYATLINGLWLPLLIAYRALQRGIDPQQMGGDTPVASASLMTARVLQNTLEQTVVAVVATALLAVSHAPLAGNLLLVQVGCFAIGRPLFWWGYHGHPILRVFGFALGFHASLCVYGYAAWFMLRAL